MSVDASMTLKLIPLEGPQSILDALLASRWTARSDGWWCIPVSEDASEWHLIQGVSRRKIEALLQVKMNANEVFGIRLWWEGHDVGGEFLVFPNGEVVFSATMNRVKLDSRTTDVSWYLARLLPVFSERSGIELESWSWSETA